MATCDLGYEHDETAEPAAAAEPPVIVDPGPNENDVKIAEIEAAAGIEREKIWTEQQELALAAENESLRGELRGIRETLDRLVAPEPEPGPAEPPAPAPVVVEPDPEPGPASPPETDKPSGGKKSGGWFDGYR